MRRRQFSEGMARTKKLYPAKSERRGGNLERRRPEIAAELIESAASPWNDIRIAAKRCGLDEKTAHALVKRLSTRYQPVIGKLREGKTKDLLALLNDRAQMALEFMDMKKMAASSAKDLAIIISVLLEKRQLLSGEPTQILSAQTRKNLDDLIPAMVKEATRRGMVIDLTPADYAVVDDAPKGRVMAADPRKRGPSKFTPEPAKEGVTA